MLIDKLAEKLGFKCREVDVGFKNISSKMLETDALIGGESSGGLTVRGYLFGKDSIFSASLFMEMQAVIKKPVSEIIAEMRSFAGYDYAIIEDNTELRSEKTLGRLFKGENPFGGDIKSYNIFNRNIKYYFKNGGWALLRMSGTEPVLRIVAEMPTQTAARAVIIAIRNFIAAINTNT